MARHSWGRRGFTLVEVIVVLVVLAILAAILIPALTGWIDESKREICASNRHQLLRYFQYEQTLYRLDNREDVTLVNVMDGQFSETANDVHGLTCPSGGHYTANGENAILCDHAGHGTVGIGGQLLHAGPGSEPNTVLNATFLNTKLGDAPITFSSSGSIDSTAVSGSRAVALSASLGTVLGEQNVVTWKLEGNNNSRNIQKATWTDVDVIGVAAGTYVRVIQYSMKTTKYTVGYLQVGQGRASTTDYNVLGNGIAGNGVMGTDAYWKADGKTSYDDYQAALSAYNDLALTAS